MGTDKEQIMFELLSKLSEYNFKLHYYKATTDSCYIKLDYGTCGSIRISDHIGIEKYKYTFNLMTDINKSYEEDNRKYYCLKDMDKMVKEIVNYREQQKKNFDYEKKTDYWKECCYRKRKGFWQICKEYRKENI